MLKTNTNNLAFVDCFILQQVETVVIIIKVKINRKIKVMQHNPPLLQLIHHLLEF